MQRGMLAAHSQSGLWIVGRPRSRRAHTAAGVLPRWNVATQTPPPVHPRIGEGFVGGARPRRPRREGSAQVSCATSTPFGCPPWPFGESSSSALGLTSAWLSRGQSTRQILVRSLCRITQTSTRQKQFPVHQSRRSDFQARASKGNSFSFTSRRQHRGRGRLTPASRVRLPCTAAGYDARVGSARCKALKGIGSLSESGPTSGMAHSNTHPSVGKERESVRSASM